MSALPIAIGVTAVALFAVGALLSLFTGRSVLFSGIRQLLIGTAAAGVTFAIGHLIGVSIAG